MRQQDGGWGGPAEESPLSFLDGPINTGKFGGETTFTLEVCAVCKRDSGGDKILGCVTFTFGDVTRKPKVPGGKRLEPEDLLKYGKGGKHGNPSTDGFVKECSADGPGDLFKQAVQAELGK